MDDLQTTAKLALAWAGALIGAITLQNWVLILTAIYTILQIISLLKDWGKSK